MKVTLVKKNYCLIARIVSFDTVGQHLLTFRILDPYPSEDNITWSQSRDLTLNAIIIVPVKSYLNQYFQVSQPLKYDGNLVVT